MIELVSHALLKKLVDEADLAAVENVREGRGGPFGASLNIINLENMHVLRIGDIAGNAVLETGVGSAHAEDQALSPENVRALKSNLKNRDLKNVAVVIASSGESCPACHAKIEILARILLHEHLLQLGHFIVAYGASYADTLNVAGFNDEPYHADMTKPENARLIRIENIPYEQLPTAIQTRLSQTGAVVQSQEGLFAGKDEREKHFTLTPEVTAMRAAAQALKTKGAAEPWDLKQATLYSASMQIGPLSYAEAQWANIARWVRVSAQKEAPSEAPGIDNNDLFRAIGARPYNNQHSTLRVVRITPFDNLGQHEWAKLQQDNPDLKNYNGVAT